MTLAKAVLGKTPEQFARALGLAELIAPPPKPEGEPRYIELPEKGISIVLDGSDRAICLQLWSAGLASSYRQYEGVMPGEIQFSNSRTELRARFGNPVKTEKGGDGLGLFGEYLFPWDIYRFGELDIHAEFSADASAIRLISVSLNAAC